jgi:MarR family 2-MHQ and catechol resistance regulon transcriptional repressor
MLVSVANITGIAKRLAKEKFIIKKADPADDRVTILEITPKGKKTLKRIANEKDDWLERMLKDLADVERMELLDLVRRVLKTGIDIHPIK